MFSDLEDCWKQMQFYDFLLPLFWNSTNVPVEAKHAPPDTAACAYVAFGRSVACSRRQATAGGMVGCRHLSIFIRKHSTKTKRQICCYDSERLVWAALKPSVVGWNQGQPVTLFSIWAVFVFELFILGFLPMLSYPAWCYRPHSGMDS